MTISSLIALAEQAGAEGKQVLIALHQVLLGHLVRDPWYAEILDRNAIARSGSNRAPVCGCVTAR